MSSIGEVTRFVDESTEDLDLFGNTPLHQCFASNEIVLTSIMTILNSHPEQARAQNQFERIPLHYALDRIRVNVDGIRLLLFHYPEGVGVKDSDGLTPYDVAVRWEHSNIIKKMILDIDSSLDIVTFMKLKYGPISNLLVWMYHPEQLDDHQTDGHINSSDDNSVTDNISDNVADFSMSVAASPAIGTRRKSWNSLLTAPFTSGVRSTLASSGRRRSFGGIPRVHSEATTVNGEEQEREGERQQLVQVREHAESPSPDVN